MLLLTLTKDPANKKLSLKRNELRIKKVLLEREWQTVLMLDGSKSTESYYNYMRRDLGVSPSLSTRGLKL